MIYDDAAADAVMTMMMLMMTTMMMMMMMMMTVMLMMATMTYLRIGARNDVSGTARPIVSRLDNTPRSEILRAVSRSSDSHARAGGKTRTRVGASGNRGVASKLGTRRGGCVHGSRGSRGVRMPGTAARTCVDLPPASTR